MASTHDDDVNYPTVSTAPKQSSSATSIRKSPAKHAPAALVANKKLPPSRDLLAPASNQPKVYKVDPIHFREVVQQLTGAPQYQRGQQPTAPTPLPLQITEDHGSLNHIIRGRGSSSATDQRPMMWSKTPASATARSMMKPRVEGHIDHGQQEMGGAAHDQSFQASWYALPLLSPGTVAAMEHGAGI